MIEIFNLERHSCLGLRGAVALALAIELNNSPLISDAVGRSILTTSMIVILASVLLVGGGTIPFLSALGLYVPAGTV